MIGAGRRPPKARPPLPPGPYLVVGLARSGAAAARMLLPHGRVLGVDSSHPQEAERLEGVEVHLGETGDDLLDGIATVVKSPGVPNDAPAIAAARDRGLAVVGELELAWRLLPNPFLAVTGTNGKTTTVELLGAILRAAGEPVAVAGNVGTPLASLVGLAEPGTHVVCEASSFQLEDSDGFAPEVAVLLNLSADHLDRHGTREAYRRAKLRIFANQGEEDWAVVPAGLDPPGRARLVRFRAGDLGRRQLRLRGPHNRENAAAAVAAARAWGIPEPAIDEALRTFAGVPNRLEETGTHRGVLYVNDSKATNVDSTRVALASFAEPVHLILGGSLKGGGFAALRGAVEERCAACYLIGAAAERLAEDLAGTVPLERCGDLPEAVSRAARAARPGDVVLLSPACASYDQYRDYEERGRHFRSLVAGLSDA